MSSSASPNTTRPRVASLLSSATEMLYGLGLADQVVAVSHECDWPPEVAEQPRVTFSHIDDSLSSLEIDTQVKQQSAAGMALYEIDRAQLETLAPDFIVTQAQCDVCAVRYEDVVSLVERSEALRHTKIISLSPDSLVDVLQDIRRLGEQLGATAAAERFLAQLNDRLTAVEAQITGAQVAGAPPEAAPRVAIIEWLDPIMIAGNWTPDLVRRAGGQYNLATAGEHSPYVDWSAIVADDPQVLIVAPCGFDIERTWSECQSLAQLDGWQNLSAVRSGRVTIMDGNAYLNRSGPRLIETVEILAHLIHPDRCSMPAGVNESLPAWRQIELL